jgi:hypothetical protein
MTESQDLNDVATAALRLIGAFEHGHSVAALEAVLAADPLVVATALGLLASPVTVTAECAACGASVQAEHDPVAAIRPGLDLISDQAQTAGGASGT